MIINTEYKGPTNTRGSRILVRAGGNKAVAISYDYRINTGEAQHRTAALKVVERLGWKGTLSEGESNKKGTGYTFIINVTAAVLPTPAEKNAGELADALDLCRDYLIEVHGENVEVGHQKDEPDCSYCRAIEQARVALEKAGR